MIKKGSIREKFAKAENSQERDEWIRQYCYAMMLFEPGRGRTYYDHYRSYIGAAYTLPSYENICSRTSEPQQAIDDLTGLLLDTLVPKERRWIKVKIQSMNDSGEDGNNFYKEEIELSDILIKTLQKSNFYPEFVGCLKDLILGTACMGIEVDENEGLIHFRHISMLEVSMDGNINDDSHTVYRKVKMDYKDFCRRYDVQPKDFGQKDDEFFIIEKVKKKSLNAKTLKPAGKKEKPDNIIDGYERQVIAFGSDEEILQTTYHIIPPLLVFRWESSGGFKYGCGPAIKQLNHIVKLNETERALEVGAGLLLRPPLLVDESQVESPEVLGGLKGGMVIQKTDAGSLTKADSDPIRPVNISGNGAEVIKLIEGYKIELRKAFYLDPYGSVEQSVRSATEVDARQSERLEKLAPMLSSFERDFLVPFVDNFFILLINNSADRSSKSKFVLSTDVLPIFQGGEYDKRVEYESPQTAVRKRNEVENLKQMVGLVQGVLGQVGAIGAIRLDNTVSFMNNSLGLPPDLLKSKSELKDLQDKLTTPPDNQQAPQSSNGSNVF